MVTLRMSVNSHRTVSILLTIGTETVHREYTCRGDPHDLVFFVEVDMRNKNKIQLLSLGAHVLFLLKYRELVQRGRVSIINDETSPIIHWLCHFAPLWAFMAVCYGVRGF